MNRVAFRSAAALVALLVAASLAASACNLQWSNYAAKVGTTVITPGELNTDLHQASSNRVFRCLLEQTSTHGYRLEGTGTSTYDSGFSAYILTNLINSDIAHSLVRSERLVEPPSAQAMAAAQVQSGLASAASSRGCGTAPPNLLQQLGSSLATVFVQLQLDQDALAARTAHITLSPASLRAYEVAHPLATRETCLSGLYAKNISTARSIEKALKSGESLAVVIAKYSPAQSASKGALGCYLASVLASVSPAIESGVAQLPAGSYTAPIPYQGEYLVLTVTSRPYEPALDALNGILAGAVSSYSREIAAAVLRAHVEVNPQYGTWRTTPMPAGTGPVGFGGTVVTGKQPAPADLLNAAAVRSKAQKPPPSLGGGVP